jgi:hypothetical protein
VDAAKLKELNEVKALLEAEAPTGASPDPFEDALVAASRANGTAR